MTEDALSAAWDALNEEYSSAKAFQAAARAAMLAAVEAAEDSGCFYPGCDHPCTSCPVDALKARIQALGQGESTHESRRTATAG